jgi:hypothetical protein
VGTLPKTSINREKSEMKDHHKVIPIGMLSNVENIQINLDKHLLKIFNDKK